MSFTIKDIKEQNGNNAYTPVADDRYTLTVETAEATTSQTGKDMIKVMFNIVSGESTGNAHKDRKLFNNFVLEGKSLSILMRFLEATNSDLLKDEEAEITPGMVAQDILGKTASAFVEVTSDGQYQNTNMKNWKAAGATAKTALFN